VLRLEFLNIDLELAFHSDPPEPEPHSEATRYLEFIEFNQQVMRENGTA
jgi:hypothetical protein